jgi:predicted PurR-regulated permease PerM
VSDTPPPDEHPAPTQPLEPDRFTLHGALFGANLHGMPLWVPHLLRRIVVLIISLVFGYAVVRQLRGFLILLLISGFLSIALEPAVTFLAKRGWKRGIATGVIFVGFGLLITLFVGLMVPLIIDQTTKLVGRLPSYLESVEEFLGDLGVDFEGDRLLTAITSIDSSLQDLATDVAGSALGVGSRLVTSLLQLLTIGLFTFYLTAEGPQIRRTLLSVASPVRQREVLRMLEVAIDKTGGYFYSRALLAAVSSTVTWFVLGMTGVPFALPLALWVGVLSQFLPVVGTYLGGILPALIALLESPGKAIIVVVFIVIYQQFENYVVAPRITARTMSLHPAIAFGSAIVGGTLMGAAGAIMALPVAATIQSFVSTYLERHQLVESHLLGESGAAEPAGG